MKKLFYLCLCAVLCGCGSDPAPDVDIKYAPNGEHNNPAHIEKVEKALNVLKESCPALFKTAASDIKEARAYFQTAYPYQTDDYGWKDQLEVSVKLKNDLKNISGNYRAWGQTLSFYMGSGKQSGIITDKRVTQEICGWEVSKDGANMFYPTEGIDW